MQGCVRRDYCGELVREFMQELGLHSARRVGVRWIEDTSARPPHPKEDLTAGGVAQSMVWFQREVELSVTRVPW